LLLLIFLILPFFVLFFFFNEHWRKRLAHLPMPKYNSTEALDALTRSAEFLKTVAERGIALPRELPLP